MTDRKLYQGGRGTSIGKEALMIHGGRQFAKLAMMLARMKEWCKQNPGKKALLSSSSELSQTLTYDVGNKVFIYSTVKIPLEPTTVDETWVRQRFFDDMRPDRFQLRENYLKETWTDIIKKNGND